MENHQPRSIRNDLRTDSLPLISIVINNHRSTEKLERCLSSLLESDYPRIEIAVVDCLTDGIESWIKKRFPNAKIIHFDQDLGPPAQFNAGLEVANSNSKYVVFMDNDIETDRRWLRLLVEVMERDIRVGAAQPKILRSRAHKEVDSIGCFIDPIGYPYRSSFSLRGRNEALRENTREVFYAETATMIVGRDVLNALPNPRKPFDSDYFIHWHDIDLSWRIWLAGYKVVVVLDSVVYHKRGVSSGLFKLSSRQMFINTRNKITTLVKNYSLRNLVKYMPLVVMFELARVAALLNRRRPDHALGTVAGYVWVLRNLKAVWKKHLEVQRLIRKVPDSYILDHLIRLNPIRLYRDFHLHYNLTSSG